MSEPGRALRSRTTCSTGPWTGSVLCQVFDNGEEVTTYFLTLLMKLAKGW